MTLSSHTAPDVRPLLERLCLVHRLLLFPVGQWPRPNNAAPSLQPHYRAFDATTGCSAPAPRFGTLALAVGAACGLSFHVIGRDEAQVLTFHTKAWSSFAPPTCRMPLGQYQGIPRADPGGRVTPRVKIRGSRLSHGLAVRKSDWQKVRMRKARQAVLELAGREVVITTPDKPFFPQAGHTKLHLVRYYAAVAEGALVASRGGRSSPNAMSMAPRV